MIAARVLVAALALAASTSAVQPPPPNPQLPRGQMPDLGRPTKHDDPLPTFNFETYFVGTWTFEWDVPDSPFGPAGTIKGTETYKPGVDGKFYESEYAADGPGGAFKGHAAMVYHPDNKVIARMETDTRGFSLLKSGTIGGDLGGYFTIYYESAPFTAGGKTVRLKTTAMLLSPVNYRVRAQISVDGGPFTNFGNPWYRKQVPGVTK
jgi:uncharacterized protein DUF1579